MIRRIALVAAAGALAVPALATADTSDTPQAKSPAQQCRALQRTMGNGPFAGAYGTNDNRSNAFGKCVSQQARDQRKNRREAVQECRTEAAAQPGSPGNSGNAPKGGIGQCVSEKAQQKNGEDQNATLNAAKTCKRLRRDEPQQFAQRYGTRANAFGKCVSSTARARHDDES